MLKTTVAGAVARAIALRLMSSAKEAVVGDEIERVLTAALDQAALNVALDLAPRTPAADSEGLAEALREQIHTADIAVSLDGTTPVEQLLHAALMQAFAPWRTEPVYEAVTTANHFNVDSETVVASLVSYALAAVRAASVSDAASLATEIRHDEVLASLRRELRAVEPARRSRQAVDLWLEHFALDDARCGFVAYTYDPAKPLWPAEDTGAVMYKPDGSVVQFGRRWTSEEDRAAHERWLVETHNHRAFTGSSDCIVLEAGDDDLPVFYLVVANRGTDQSILTHVGVDVRFVEPLLGIPETQVLESLVTYEISVPGALGRHLRPAIPALRVPPNDAAAFHVRLAFPQGYAIQAQVVLTFGGQAELTSPPVYLAF